MKRRHNSLLQITLLFSLLLFIVPIATAAALESDRDLIGWSERNQDTDTGAIVEDEDEDSVYMKEDGQIVLSWEPRIFLFRGLLTDEECDHLIDKALPRLERSGVVEEGGGDGISEIRTSDGMFFNRGEDKVLENIERKLSEWTLIPVGHGEGVQLLRYQVTEHGGQEYKPHFDYFFHEQGEDNGGNRLATVLMYLSTVEEGGETVFPNAPVPSYQTRAAGYSECAMQGLAVRPKKGDAVLFFSLRTEGQLDQGSLHGSCPIIKGTKYSATKWYHVAHYAMGGEQAQTVHHVLFVPPPPPTPPGCKDSHKECPGWAQGGECENNSGFMIGTQSSPGDCLLSCGRCDLMQYKLRQGRKQLNGGGGGGRGR